MGVSGKLETAIGMGLATTFVMTLASACSYLMEHYIPIPAGHRLPAHPGLHPAIAVVVQFTEMVIRKSSPTLYRLLGIFLPLITTNCAVLGVALLSINERHNFIQSIIYGFSAAAGFLLVLILFAAMRERLVAADVPPFRRRFIAMVTAGLMSLAFMGFVPASYQDIAMTHIPLLFWCWPCFALAFGIILGFAAVKFSRRGRSHRRSARRPAAPDPVRP